MEEFISRFGDHLKYERNVSEHTLRNYMSDLEQFHDHLCPVDSTGKRRHVDIKQIDHITVREYLSKLYQDKRKKTSIARKLATSGSFTLMACSTVLPPCDQPRSATRSGAMSGRWAR